MSVATFYVCKGFSKVAIAPVILRAVVGPGLVLCVRTAEATMGGLVHLESEGLNKDSNPDRMVAKAGGFLEELRCAGGKLAHATADIVGCADILHLYPQHLRQAMISTEVAHLTAFLDTKNIEVNRVRVGGAEARRVDMVLPGAALEVHLISKPRRKGKVVAPKVVALVPPSKGRSARPHEVVVGMGCLGVAKSPSRLLALLGSCVGIALYDPITKIGALAHVMLPSSKRSNDTNRSKFADTAVPALIEALSNAGASPNRAVAKLAGGANVLRSMRRDSAFHIGRANTEASLHALGEFDIGVAWQDTGGQLARKMTVGLDNFRVSIRLIQKTFEGL